MVSDEQFICQILLAAQLDRFGSEPHPIRIELGGEAVHIHGFTRRLDTKTTRRECSNAYRFILCPSRWCVRSNWH